MLLQLLIKLFQTVTKCNIQWQNQRFNWFDSARFCPNPDKLDAQTYNSDNGTCMAFWMWNVHIFDKTVLFSYWNVHVGIVWKGGLYKYCTGGRYCNKCHWLFYFKSDKTVAFIMLKYVTTIYTYATLYKMIINWNLNITYWSRYGLWLRRNKSNKANITYSWSHSSFYIFFC